MRTTSRVVETARKLRRTMSIPEVRLWQHMRGVTPRFQRQHPLGAYVLDFYCAAAKLAVEIDGESHAMGDRPTRNERRDAWLVEQGLVVVHIPAAEVLRDPGQVADGLMRHAASLAPAPPPPVSPPPSP